MQAHEYKHHGAWLYEQPLTGLCERVYSLRGNALGAAGAGALAEALKLNAVLTHLDLSNNALTDYSEDMSGIRALAAALSSGKAVLKKLDLRFNNLCGGEQTVRDAAHSGLELLL